MAKRGFSIQKGFEYQDYVCAVELVELIRSRALDTTFIIESDQAHHVDDMQVFPTSGSARAYQVKFHVDQSHVESFASVCEKPTARSRSLLQKLFRGWTEVSNDGESSCEIEFISASGVEPGKHGFGSALDTTSGKIGERFFTDDKYKEVRDAWAAHLSIDVERLRSFLGSVHWRFSYLSTRLLHDRLEKELRNTGLPHHRSAILAFVVAVAHYAEDVRERTSVAAFLIELSQTPRFREACEQQFSELDFGRRTRERARRVRVAAVDMRFIHAFRSREFACLEEPAALSTYISGISAPKLSGVFDDLRTAWLAEYSAWLSARTREILSGLAALSPDIIVFPRFSFDIDAALEVYAWCQDHNCAAVFGADCAGGPGTTADDLNDLLNVKTFPSTRVPETDAIPTTDIILRPDRAGRASLSSLASPYNSREALLTEIRTCEVITSSGLLSVLSAPSVAAAEAFIASKAATPELIISASSHLGESVRAKLLENEPLHSVPFVCCSSDPAKRSSIFLLNSSEAPAPYSGGWEGITVADIVYDRSGSRWSASVNVVERRPIVYHDSDPSLVSTDEWVTNLRGVRNSVDAARYEASQRVDRPAHECCVVVRTDDPDNFFIRRLELAVGELRAVIGGLELDQMQHAHRALAELSARLGSYNSEVVRVHLRPSPDLNIRPWIRPALVDRNDETRSISRLADGSSTKRILLLSGPAGIGKRAIIAQVARTTQGADSWIEMDCIANSSFPEFLGHLMIKLGVDAREIPNADAGTFGEICGFLEAAKCPLLVLNNAHFLPVAPEQQNHTDMLALLSTIAQWEGQRPPRVLLCSTRRGSIRGFSGSHLLEEVVVSGLGRGDTLRLLQDLVAAAGIDASTEELEAIAGQVHGHPGLAETAVSLLQNISAPELIEGLHARTEVEKYIVGTILGRTSISEEDISFLKYASLFRIAVDRAAFAASAGAYGRAIIQELTERLLINERDGRIQVNALLAHHFRAKIAAGAEAKQLHKMAFEHLDAVLRRRALTLEEVAERIYHGLGAGVSIDLRDFKLFTGPARTAMIAALRGRDWHQLKSCAATILDVFHEDPVARVAHTVALDALSEKVELDAYSVALTRLDQNDVWIAVELARSRIRAHDWDAASEILAILERRYGLLPRILAVRAQLAERRGEVSKAIDFCTAVFSDARAHPGDISSAAAVLRRAGQLDILISYVETTCDGVVRDERLRRQYGYACVVTRHDTAKGIDILSRSWADHPQDGAVVADFASALGQIREDSRAEELFKQGLNCTDGYAAVLEGYGLFLHEKGRFKDATNIYRELHGLKPHFHHISRRYARNLFDEAREAHSNSEFSIESVCIQDAEHVLGRLIELAPFDEWASFFLAIVKRRDYGADPTLPSDSPSPQPRQSTSG